MQILCLTITIGLVAFFADAASTGQVPMCLDDDGKPVDWYIVYKIPPVGQKAPFDSGYAYGFITSDDVNAVDPLASTLRPYTDVESVTFLNKFKHLLLRSLDSYNKKQKSSKTASDSKPTDKLYWTISNKLLSDPDSMVQRTLAIAYNKSASSKRSSDNLNYIFYNDQPPIAPGEDKKKDSASRAHAKGVVLIDDSSGDGVWLTHSTPRYPPHTVNKLEFGTSSRRNAQTFMCISFDIKRSGKQIVKHLVTMVPLVYESRVSKQLEDMIPELNNLPRERERKRIRRGEEKLAQVITTRAGQDLLLYSKSAKFGHDLYFGWITQEIQSPLYVETWRRGSGEPLNSSCPLNDYHVNNVKDIHVKSEHSLLEWEYLRDHSKWAITETENPGVVCIADINRAESQFQRGGGAVCIKCPSCWQVFSQTIQDLEPCPRSSKKPKKHETENSTNVSPDSASDLIERLRKLVAQ